MKLLLGIDFNFTQIIPLTFLTLPSLFAYIYVTCIFPMEGSSKVRLQFVHSSVKSDFGGARRQSERRVKGDDVVCCFEFN